MSDAPESFADISGAEEDRGKSRKSNLLPFLLLVLAVVIGGTIARTINQKRVADLVFSEPITTKVQARFSGGTDIEYAGRRIGNRAAFQIGGLRVIFPAEARGSGSSSGSMHLSERSRSRNSATASAGGLDVEMEWSGTKAKIVVEGGTSITIEETSATLAGRTFNLREKQVVVLDGPDSIGETRKIE